MGKVSRKLGLEQAAQVKNPDIEAMRCALCARTLGRRVEWHHVVPRSEGGRDTVPLHPICHRAIHAAADNAELARLGDLDGVRALPSVERFLAWIADKPPDFNAPTRRRR